MARLGRFLRDMEGGYGHWCPGCEEMHYIAVEKPLANGAQWTFDGDVEAPTFSPSVRHTHLGLTSPECCHYFIRGGNIEFCGDCTHALSGQTVPLPPWPEDA